MRRRRRRAKKVQEVGLEALYDDGFGEATVRDYFDALRATPLDGGGGGGPPRWFCPVECGPPAVHAPPLLLFLPGLGHGPAALLAFADSLGDTIKQTLCVHNTHRNKKNNHLLSFTLEIA